MSYHSRTTSGRFDCWLLSPGGMRTERRRSAHWLPECCRGDVGRSHRQHNEGMKLEAH